MNTKYVISKPCSCQLILMEGNSLFLGGSLLTPIDVILLDSLASLNL